MKHILATIFLSLSTALSPAAQAPGIFDLIEAHRIGEIRRYIEDGMPLNAVKNKSGTYPLLLPVVNHQGLSPLQFALAKDNDLAVILLKKAGAVEISPIAPYTTTKAARKKFTPHHTPLETYCKHYDILRGTRLWRKSRS